MADVFVDTHGREVRYLRVSVTDRCNLSCMYCSGDSSYIPHDSIMRFEEIERFVNVCVEHGVDKVRLTGGEPFIRKGFGDFLIRLRNNFPDLDIRITTNGTLLKKNISLIKETRAKINLSLDTFIPEKFKKISTKDFLPVILDSLYALIDEGVPLKINAVAMKGVNDDELESFVMLAKNNNVDVRFIEFMPMGEGTIWGKNIYWSAQDIVKQAQEYAELAIIPRSDDSAKEGPAQMYSIKDGLGRFGVITPISSHFCATCNRLRITSDGKLRTCLFDDKEYDITSLVRLVGVDDNTLAQFIGEATKKKQIGADILKNRKEAVALKRMVAIGG